MDVSHAILFLENADFVRITGLYFPANFEFYNREQVPNPRHNWSDENFPVTKLTGCNVARQVAVKLDKKCKTSETCISSGVAR